MTLFPRLGFISGFILGIIFWRVFMPFIVAATMAGAVTIAGGLIYVIGLGVGWWDI